MLIDYDEKYKYSIWALKINRSYPTVRKDRKWLASFIVLHGTVFVFFCFIVNSIINHDLKDDNFSVACTNGIFSILFLSFTFKYLILLYKQEDIIQAIDKVKADYEFAKNLPPDELAIVMKYMNTAAWVTKMWLLVCLGTFSVFPMNTFCRTVYYYAIGDFRLVPMYEMTYPAAIERRKDTTTMYLLLLVLQIYYGLYTLLMYVGFTPLGLIFMLHACGQLEIAKYKIGNLFNGERYDPLEIRERLKIIVNLLQEVLNYVDHLRNTFTVAYELYMKATIIVLPIALYENIQSFKQGHLSVEFMTFIVAGGILFFAPCYCSDLLMEKGHDVRFAVYASGWESYPDVSMRRTLVIMLSRLERDVAIRTLFRTVNLDAFAELIHQSYALFSVINAAWD